MAYFKHKSIKLLNIVKSKDLLYIHSESEGPLLAPHLFTKVPPASEHQGTLLKCLAFCREIPGKF